MLILLILFCFGFLLSAFFSGYETGVYSLNDIRLAHRANAGSVIAKYLSEMRHRPDSLIITILVGNNIANFIASSSLARALELTMPAHFPVAVMTTAVLTPLLLILGEIVPKRLFASRPSRFCYSPYLYIVFRVFRTMLIPVVVALAPFQRALTRLFRSERHPATVTVNRRRLQESFRADKAAMNETLGRIAGRLMETMHLPVQELMLPFPACTVAPADLTVDSFINIAMQMRRSRIPVFEKDPRKPVGLVDIFSALNVPPDADGKRPTPLATIVKPLRFIGADLSAYEALRLMQRWREPLVAVSKDGKTVIGLLPMSALAAQIGLGR